jgi:hypothetical protein
MPKTAKICYWIPWRSCIHELVRVIANCRTSLGFEGCCLGQVQLCWLLYHNLPLDFPD